MERGGKGVVQASRNLGSPVGWPFYASKTCRRRRRRRCPLISLPRPPEFCRERMKRHFRPEMVLHENDHALVYYISCCYKSFTYWRRVTCVFSFLLVLLGAPDLFYTIHYLHFSCRCVTPSNACWYVLNSLVYCYIFPQSPPSFDPCILLVRHPPLILMPFWWRVQLQDRAQVCC